MYTDEILDMWTGSNFSRQEKLNIIIFLQISSGTKTLEASQLFAYECTK